MLNILMLLIIGAFALLVFFSVLLTVLAFVNSPYNIKVNNGSNYRIGSRGFSGKLNVLGKTYTVLSYIGFCILFSEGFYFALFFLPSDFGFLDSDNEYNNYRFVISVTFGIISGIYVNEKLSEIWSDLDEARYTREYLQFTKSAKLQDQISEYARLELIKLLYPHDFADKSESPIKTLSNLDNFQLSQEDKLRAETLLNIARNWH